MTAFITGTYFDCSAPQFLIKSIVEIFCNDFALSESNKGKAVNMCQILKRFMKNTRASYTNFY